jgi:hypothetical protein
MDPIMVYRISNEIGISIRWQNSHAKDMMNDEEAQKRYAKITANRLSVSSIGVVWAAQCDSHLRCLVVCGASHQLDGSVPTYV